MYMDHIFLPKNILVMMGVFFFITCITNANSVTRCQRFYLGQSYKKIDLKQEIYNLEGQLAQSDIYRKELEFSPPRIAKVIEEIANGGTTHRGVYRVLLEDGRRLVLKISTEAGNVNSVLVPTRNNQLVSVERNFNDTLVIQNFLAVRGVSPQIHALYDEKSLVAMFSKLKKANPFLVKKDLVSEERIGILMDDMGDAWNGAGATPINFKLSISKLNLVKQLSRIKKMLAKYHLYVSDQQIFINENGDVRLADLDFSVYVPGINPRYKMSVKNEAEHVFERLTNQIPFGWLRKGHRLVKNKEEQHYLSFILKMHKEGSTALEIANILNQEAPRSNRGLRWLSADIERILR